MTIKRETEWFDDDALWHDLYPIMFSETRFAQADDEIEKVLRLAEPQGKAVLDLCCGPGRHSIALAQRGFAVTGIDKTKYLLDKAIARDIDEKVEWIQADMRDFVRPKAFDLVLSMHTSFGYFENQSDDVAVLTNILASLRPGGTCLIEVAGKEIVARVFQPTRSHTLSDGTKLVQRQEILDDWTRIRCEWVLTQDGTSKSHTVQHTIYSGRELKERMQHAGFINIKLCGDFDGTEYGPHAQRLIAIGEKDK